MNGLIFQITKESVAPRAIPSATCNCGRVVTKSIGNVIFTFRNTPQNCQSVGKLRLVGARTLLAPCRDSVKEALCTGDGMAVAHFDNNDFLNRNTRGFGRDDIVSSKRSKARDVQHEALQLVKQRALLGSQPGQRTDSFKLGLVVEGGGMRGCVSGGALQALDDLGLRDVFDAVYGASAGALNATYFLSGQRDGVEIYHDYIATPDFIDLKRLWKARGHATAADIKPVLDLDFLVHTIMDGHHLLDWDAVLNSPIPLKIIASSLDLLAPVTLSGFESKQDLITCLKASANVPEIAGGPVLHRGHRLVDAAVFEPVPFRSAIADGCTHVIVLCNRARPTHKGFLNTHLDIAMTAVVKRAVMSPEYMAEAWKMEMEYLAKEGSEDDMLVKSFEDDAFSLPWFGGSHVYPIYPNHKPVDFSPICIDVPILKAGVAEGRRMVMEVMESLLEDQVDLTHRNNILPASSIITNCPEVEKIVKS